MATTNAGLGSISAVAAPGPGHKSDTDTAYGAGKIHSFQTNTVEKSYVDFEGSYNGHDGIFGGKAAIAETLAVTGDTAIGGGTDHGARFGVNAGDGNTVATFESTDANANIYIIDSVGSVVLACASGQLNLYSGGDGGALTNPVIGLNIDTSQNVTIPNGIFAVSDETDASSATVASLKTAGGIACEKSLWVGDDLIVAGNVASFGANALASNLALSLNTAVTKDRAIVWQTGGVSRWILKANNTAEGGADAGSDWVLLARNDVGGAIGTAFTITRSTMAVSFGAALAATGNLTVSGAGPHVFDGLATEAFELIDAGSVGASEQDWVEIEVGGNQGFLRVFAAK